MKSSDRGTLVALGQTLEIKKKEDTGRGNHERQDMDMVKKTS